MNHFLIKYSSRFSGHFAIFLLILFVGCNSGYRADIKSLIAPSSLPYLKTSKLIQVASVDTSGGNDDRLFIAPGKKVNILHVEGPGMIVRIWLKVDSRDPYYLRRIVIRMYWDDNEKPSVEAPLGDFFGCGFDYKPYTSIYLGMADGGFVCYFPMPFERSARIEISNETMQEIRGLSYQIGYQKFEEALESDVAYFNAHWNRSIRTSYDSNYTALKIQGKGHIVGINMNIQSYDGKFRFLQGDEMFYVDGEKRPSIQGTGTGDYFSAGQGFPSGEFSGLYAGLIYKDDSLGRLAAYRFHTLDPIPFKKSIHLTFEHGNQNQVVADYSSTVYWYQMESKNTFAPFPIASQRIPIRIAKPVKMLEAESLPFRLEGLRTRVQEMSEFGPDWGNNRQLLIEARKGARFWVDLTELREPFYYLDLYYTKGPDYGNADIFLNDINVGKIQGYSPYILPTGKVRLEIPEKISGWEPIAGAFKISFRVTEKDSLSKGYHLGIDGISLAPHRVYIPEWYILGPFPNPRSADFRRRGLDTIYVPEVYIDLRQNYTGAGGKSIGWQYHRTPEDGYFSFSDKIYPNERVIAYAVTYIYSPDKRKVNLFTGSDDGCKVFLNRKMLFRYDGERIAEPDQAETVLDLNPGWNQLLLKIDNNIGQFAFFARLIDIDHKLVISADRKHYDE